MMNRTMIALIVSSVGLFALAADGPPPAAPAPKPPAPTAPPPPAPGTTAAGAIGGMMGGVLGGPHDFTRFGGSACSACHIPHVQAVVPTTQPSTQPAAELFRIPGQRQVFVPGRYSPGPTSLICLGCHDGTVATSTIGSAHALLAGVREGFAVPDGFAWRDHPIGVTYPSKPREFRPAGFVSQKMLLPDGKVECVSCHDPHNVAGVKHMLWMSNARSAVCLNCHIK